MAVFEGIDHVGKSTIAKSVAEELEKNSIKCNLYSFSGKERNTLGGLVYELHHDISADAIKIDPLSKQLLHIAAHVDSLKNKIIPNVLDGKIVILDRYWWSTYAYGIGDNLDRQLIDDITLVERKLLNQIDNKLIFYVTRELKEKDFNELKTEKILKEYDRLCEITKDSKVIKIENNQDIEDAVKKALSAIILWRKHEKL